MINKVFFIGDSHTGFFSGCTENIHNVKFYQIGNHESESDGLNLYFGWQHSQPAYKIGKDSLKKIIDPFYEKIDKDSLIVFEFGTMDALFHSEKFNTYEVVVERYVESCRKFAEDLGAKFIFMESWNIVPTKKGCQVFNMYLNEYCSKKGIIAPIKVIGNIVEYNYKSEDFYNHLGRKDSKKVLEYCIKLVKELF